MQLYLPFFKSWRNMIIARVTNLSYPLRSPLHSVGVVQYLARVIKPNVIRINSKRLLYQAGLFH